jgi:hypothetical protein|mmetsp:Transcript_114408/g.180128  ORF Transcript_114408/g.180128 Transcript_114408/m.180128 type:complete len:85 (+) Transcript_114408:2560-2814(+)
MQYNAHLVYTLLNKFLDSFVPFVFCVLNVCTRLRESTLLNSLSCRQHCVCVLLGIDQSYVLKIDELIGDYYAIGAFRVFGRKIV